MWNPGARPTTPLTDGGYQFTGKPHEDEASTSDGLENYEILEKIGQGKTTTVYAAICKRGRLRNRKVALKKSKQCPPKAYETAVAQQENTPPLQQALHHPTIVSLLSSFSTSSAHYQVFELCAHGSLLAFLTSRTPPILSESELRGVLKSLLEALIYLKKELVVHQNITPANILLTEEYRVKLADFSLAKYVSAERSAAKTTITPVDNISPENNSYPASSFATDLWSLGCLIVTCLSGVTMCNLEPMLQDSEMTSFVDRHIPEGVSYEARDLINSILKFNPKHRIPLHRVLSHPFFDPSQPIEPLGPSFRVVQETHTRETSLGHCYVYRRPGSTMSSINSLPKQVARWRHDILFRSKRKTLGDIKNTDLRNVLRDEISSSIVPALPTRRIASDPLPRKGSLSSGLSALTSEAANTIHLASAEKNRPFPLIRSFHISSDAEPLRSVRPKLLPLYHPTSPSNTNVGSYERAGRHHWPLFRDVPDRSTLPKGTETLIPADKDIPFEKESRVVSPVNISVGTTRPLPFSTVLLPPRSHKSIHGQVTVLPSHSLLVDFRESERKRGKKGDEVFVIDPTGMEVKVFHAPHLSAPCCLVEPSDIFATSLLPSKYWKQYNDAGHLVEQIKQRTSKMIIYNPNAKCILMANTPKADIELLFPASPTHHPSHRTRRSSNADSQTPSMRIRLSRRQQSVEIARYVLREDGVQGEWTKKLLRFDQGQEYGVGDDEMKAIDSVLKEGLKEMMRYLLICEAVEKVELERGGVLTDFSSPETMCSDPATIRCQVVQNQFPSTEATISETLPIELELHSIPASRPYPPTPSSIQQEPSSQIPTPFSLGNLDSPRHIQTRFLPSIGWCIRYPSLVSQGGRYKIMFLDGVALEVDVDEEWIVCRGEGGVSRHKVGEWGGKGVGERMKVFGRFIDMFENAE